jgi:glycosyltransferase involved in cell wall biosynthesis
MVGAASQGAEQMTLSLCTIAYDEEAFIEGMLRSVEALVDEVVIGIDSRTSDRTMEIVAASPCPTTVIHFNWLDDFAYARNLTIDAAQGDWILHLDADERLTPAGAAAVREILDVASPEPTEQSVLGIAFMLANYDLDGALRSVFPTAPRLFRRRPEIRYHRRVHEVPVWMPDPDQGEVVLIGGDVAIAHFGYAPDIYDQRHKSERNLRLLKLQVAEHPDDAHAVAKLRQLESVLVHS